MLTSRRFIYAKVSVIADPGHSLFPLDYTSVKECGQGDYQATLIASVRSPCAGRTARVALDRWTSRASRRVGVGVRLPLEIEPASADPLRNEHASDEHR